MSAAERKPVAETDFREAMQLVGMARTVLAPIDYDGLHALLSDRDGTLCFRDPTLFMRIQADPQWQAKCDLVRAAADFQRSVDALVADLPPE